MARMADPQMRGAYCAAIARDFHSTRSIQAIKPVLLADIGEGIVILPLFVFFLNFGRGEIAQNTSQVLLSAKSYNGSWSRKPEWRSSRRYAKSRATKRRSR